MFRRSARIAAVQAVYQYDMSDCPDLDGILGEFLNFRDGRFATLHNIGRKFDPELFSELTRKTIENLSEISKIVQDRLPPSWPESRISKIILAILRVGSTEMMFFLNTPVKVILNEYIDVTRSFGMNSKELVFVNGVLNAISNNLRKDEKNSIQGL